MARIILKNKSEIKDYVIYSEEVNILHEYNSNIVPNIDDCVKVSENDYIVKSRFICDNTVYLSVISYF